MGVEALVPFTSISAPLRMIGWFNACAEISGVPRPPGLCKLHSNSKHISVWVTEAIALVEALIHISEPLQVPGHGPLLVGKTIKVARETSTGEAGRDFGVSTRPPTLVT
jgi:hypothetical protein